MTEHGQVAKFVGDVILSLWKLIAILFFVLGFIAGYCVCRMT